MNAWGDANCESLNFQRRRTGMDREGLLLNVGVFNEALARKTLLVVKLESRRKTFLVKLGPESFPFHSLSRKTDGLKGNNVSLRGRVKWSPVLFI